MNDLAQLHMAEHRTPSVEDHQPPEAQDRRLSAVGSLAPRLVTVPHAATLLGIGRTTAYELIRSGDLEVVHIGRSTRVPIAAVDAFVDRLRQRPAL